MDVQVGVIWMLCMIKGPSDELSLVLVRKKRRENDQAWAEGSKILWLDGRDERTRQAVESDCVKARGYAGSGIGAPKPSARGDFMFPGRISSGKVEDGVEVGRQRPVLEFFFGSSEGSGHGGQQGQTRGRVMLSCARIARIPRIPPFYIIPRPSPRPRIIIPSFPRTTSSHRFQSTDNGKPGPPAPLSTRVWKKVKHEAQHYWHGSKLLVSEVRISARLQWKILHGEILTRRERRQLRRTTQDLLRLVPFSVFVIVPFMELLLPVALKLFPSMLPSTFEDKFAAEEKQRKLLRVRLDMAKFLQETLRESGLRANSHIVGSDAFKEFFRKVRSTGEAPSTHDVINVAKLFDDDLTLDNLSRPQLVSMSRYMGLNAFGTDNFLRGAIRSRLVNLRRDDQLIYTEGIDELSVPELQAACQSRGIRTFGVSPARLREELSSWIQLHLHNRVSGVLLVLGRAFQFDRKPGDDEDGKTAIIKSLEAVLCGLPDNLLNEAELEVDDKASYKQKLEVLQQQEELIEDEEEQEQKEEDARRAAREAAESETHTAQSLLPDSEVWCSFFPPIFHVLSQVLPSSYRRSLQNPTMHV